MAGKERHGYDETPAGTLPVLQLLVTKRVVDVHYIPAKERDDPQSDKYRTLLLVTSKLNH